MEWWEFVYVKQFQRSCYRAKSKTCYLKWIARQSNSATRRIETFSKNTKQKPIYLIFSVPLLQINLPVKVLRQRLSHILKLGKIQGGAVIFHPFGFDKTKNKCYPKPHFHFVGFGREWYFKCVWKVWLVCKK